MKVGDNPELGRFYCYVDECTPIRTTIDLVNGVYFAWICLAPSACQPMHCKKVHEHILRLRTIIAIVPEEIVLMSYGLPSREFRDKHQGVVNPTTGQGGTARLLPITKQELL